MVQLKQTTINVEVQKQKNCLPSQNINLKFIFNPTKNPTLRSVQVPICFCQFQKQQTVFPVYTDFLLQCELHIVVLVQSKSIHY